MFEKPIIALSNRLTRLRRVRVKPANLLLLVSHCLQSGECGEKIVPRIANCKGCDRCNIAALCRLVERYGVGAVAVNGGRQALEFARGKDVHAVVAVACYRELAQGILGLFPKPVLAVSNAQPYGPCHDTVVDIAPVEAAIRSMIAGD